jgi:hypothetical protein
LGSKKPIRPRPADKKVNQLIFDEFNNLWRWREICSLLQRTPELCAQLRRPDLPEKEAVEVILRYGAAAERPFDKTLDHLERRQHRRVGEAVPPQ